MEDSVLQPLRERCPAPSTGPRHRGDHYGRITEVTRENEIVWEYVSPYSTSEKVHSARMFRAYRVPYEWIPQLPRPVEKAVIPPKNSDFKVSAKP
jgi:hypothetical protein